VYGPMAFAVAVEALNLTVASRNAKREQSKRNAVKLRPTYASIDESLAVGAAVSDDPEAGSVGLSSKPVAGKVSDEDERTGLG